MLAAGRRRLRLLPVLFRDPGEFSARLTKDLEILSDHLTQRAHQYAACQWDVLVGELGQLYAETPSVLGEKALESIESEVGTAIADSKSSPLWNLMYDADIGLARCAYLMCRLVRPALVVETGVAHGVTSAFILQALAENRHGTLHSIDLPPLESDLEQSVGRFVPDRLRERWHLHVGSSRRELPRVVAGKPVDLFLHDSVHTYRTMTWEFATVWSQLRSGGVLLSDDVQNNNAFEELTRRDIGFWRVVREEGKAVLFGIAIKH
jgi:hypothetical protein